MVYISAMLRRCQGSRTSIGEVATPPHELKIDESRGVGLLTFLGVSVDCLVVALVVIPFMRIVLLVTLSR